MTDNFGVQLREPSGSVVDSVVSVVRLVSGWWNPLPESVRMLDPRARCWQRDSIIRSSAARVVSLAAALALANSSMNLSRSFGAFALST